MAAEDNQAYGVSDPHEKGGQTEKMYETHDVIQLPPASHECVYEGID